jgi:hypothetical protein
MNNNQVLVISVLQKAQELSFQMMETKQLTYKIGIFQAKEAIEGL